MIVGNDKMSKAALKFLNNGMYSMLEVVYISVKLTLQPAMQSMIAKKICLLRCKDLATNSGKVTPINTIGESILNINIVLKPVMVIFYSHLRFNNRISATESVDKVDNLQAVENVLVRGASKMAGCSV